MARDELHTRVAEREANVDVESAWGRVRPRIEARRRRRRGGMVTGAIAVVAVALVGVGALLVRDDGDGNAVVATPDATSPPTEPGLGDPPRDGTLAPVIEAAEHLSNGGRELVIQLVDGNDLAVELNADTATLLASFDFSETVPVFCEERDCGFASAHIVRDAVDDAPILQTFQSPDGGSVELVDGGDRRGPLLRWVRNGWTVDVPTLNVPEASYQIWVEGLTPVVNPSGWLELQLTGDLITAQPLSAGASSQEPQGAYMHLRLAPCSAEGDGERIDGPGDSPTLLASRCFVESGILMTVQGPEAVARTMLAGVRAP